MFYLNIQPYLSILHFYNEGTWSLAKWLSGDALQIAVKRREVKSKREKER